jgi:hypothetical protein
MLKEIFKNRLIKDGTLSLVFVLCIYVITHNEITHPTPRPQKGNWSIQKMQHPLFFGLAGHNYLVIRDPVGDIVYEIHGLATDSKKGTWKYIGTDSSDLLKVWEFNEPRDYYAEKKYPGIILAEGNKEDMLALWEKARSCKESINAKTFYYPPYGFSLENQTTNSNSVAYTITKCMNIGGRRIGIITPGEEIDLLEEK